MSFQTPEVDYIKVRFRTARLFRGQKWLPLRFNSIRYSMEESATCVKSSNNRKESPRERILNILNREKERVQWANIRAISFFIYFKYRARRYDCTR